MPPPVAAYRCRLPLPPTAAAYQVDRVVAYAKCSLGQWAEPSVANATRSLRSLLPLVLYPALGVLPAAAVSTNYFKDKIVLFFGGLVVAAALESVLSGPVCPCASVGGGGRPGACVPGPSCEGRGPAVGPATHAQKW